jgi:hypothetical protein
LEKAAPLFGIRQFGESGVSMLATSQSRGSYKPSQSTIVLGVTLVLFVALSLALPGFASLGT